MKIKCLALLALLLLFIIPGCGDDSGVTVNYGTTPAPVGASTVQGTVYGADGQPVGAGITVRLTPSIASSENYGEQQTTTTNAQGFFSFTVNYTGSYLIDALNGTQLLGSQLFNITGAGQIINILLGQATGQLTVNIVPTNAEATVNVCPGGDITTSAAFVTGSQTGEYIFYLPAGLYTVRATATGYNEVPTQSITVAEGGEQTLTFDFSAGGEVPVFTYGIDPYACINTGNVPVKYYAEEFTGTGTIDFILKATGAVVKTVTVDESNLNSITIPNYYLKTSSSPYSATFYYLAFTIDTTGMPVGLYTVRLTHNPPVIGGSSTTAETEFYVSDTIQGALNAAGAYYGETPQEIVTPWGNKFEWYTKVYIPAGNYQQGISSTFPGGDLNTPSYIYFQGAGIGNTIIDFSGNASSINPGTEGVVEGFTIKKSTDGSGAVYLFDNSYCFIYNNRIESNVYGIYGDYVYDNYYFNNIITKNTEQGIYLYHSENLNIGNNVISENGGGIYCDELYEANFITGNNIYKNTPDGGIVIAHNYGTTCDIANNVISENICGVGGGIFVYNTSTGPVNIKGNEITKNTSGGEGGGIYYEGTTAYSNITGNNIYGNTAPAVPSIGKQLWCGPGLDQPPINATNNWWNVTIDDNEVYKVTDVPAGTQSVDIGTPATTQFPVPVVPTI